MTSQVLYFSPSLRSGLLSQTSWPHVLDLRFDDLVPAFIVIAPTVVDTSIVCATVRALELRLPAPFGEASFTPRLTRR